MLQPRPMKFAPLFLLVASLLLTATHARADDLRFSVTLNAPDRQASGLAKLTSDQVAVIDALVRRDTSARAGSVTATPAKASENPNATFSQRLTAEERRTAGLLSLSAAEIAQLDAFVDRHQSAKLARTLLAPPSYLSPSRRIDPTEKKTEREIHGSFSLSYGMGSGGYSEKTGSMVLSLEDPARGYSITVGYSESHVKGGNGYGYYRDPFYRDPFYDLPRTLPPDESVRPSAP